MSRRRLVLTVGAAWLPFLIMDLVRFGIRDGYPVGTTLGFAYTNYSAGILHTFAVWKLTALIRWPAQFRVSFLLVHVVAALAFFLSFTTYITVIESLIRGVNAFAELVTWSFPWYFPFYAALYGVTAGFCYAARIQLYLRHQERAAALATTSAVRARLAALRAQLNPHFLFNSLHGLSSLVGRDPVAAERAIEKLGDMLRYALGDGDADDVRLEEEWRFTRNYLELEEMRLDNPVSVSVDFENEALDAWVPPFILQPLVENAVRHGIAPRGDEGKIRISAHLLGERVVIRVADNGVGDREAHVHDARGLGLRSVRERLHAWYGGEATLEIHTAPDEGFIAITTIPVRSPSRYTRLTPPDGIDAH
ncbi:MAG: histidine kinase [Gemmatimonadales bacterium]